MGLSDVINIGLALIVGLASIVAAQWAWAEREALAEFAGAIWRRFVYVPSHAELVRRIADDDTEPIERPNDRALRSNAIEPRSVGASGSVESPKMDVVDAATLTLMQRIAAHKVTHPGDGKEVSALAVSGAKKGSSKAYQAFSAAWDLLYPPLQPDILPPESPEAWEAGPRPGQLVRR